MTMANADLRKEARAACVPFWMIGEALNVSEPTMTRKLRRELPAEEKAHIRAIIKQLKAAANQKEA
jgi:hypothetical protein